MRSGRAAALLPCVALLAALATGVGAAAREGCAGDEAVGSGPVLLVRLTTSDSLPAAAKASLTREVEEIWRRAGVRVQWPGLVADVTATPDATLRVLVVQRESPTNNREHQWPVGELLRDQNERSVAVVSMAAAERVLAAAARSDEPTALLDRRLGMVLGRAVAHEIGHYLLDTPGHSRQGLMRAQIEARDFVDLRSGAFYLDAAAGQWIREGLGSRSAVQPRLARFAYAR